MAIKNYKPNTAGTRHVSTLSTADITKTAPENHSLSPLRKLVAVIIQAVSPAVTLAEVTKENTVSSTSREEKMICQQQFYQLNMIQTAMLVFL